MELTLVLTATATTDSCSLSASYTRSQLLIAKFLSAPPSDAQAEDIARRGLCRWMFVSIDQFWRRCVFWHDFKPLTDSGSAREGESLASDISPLPRVSFLRVNQHHYLSRYLPAAAGGFFPPIFSSNMKTALLLRNCDKWCTFQESAETASTPQFWRILIAPTIVHSRTHYLFASTRLLPFP